MAKVLPSWVPPAFFWGGLFWLSTFQWSKLAKSHGYPLIAEALNGYMLGVITAYSGWLIGQIWQGKAHRFIDNSPFFRGISILSLIVVCALGLVGMAVDVFGGTSWPFNIMFIMGGVYVGKALVPFIRHSGYDEVAD